MKKTLIIGATSNEGRYAYAAAKSLSDHGHEIELLGIRPGKVLGQEIDVERKQYSDIDTVTLYIGAKHQPDYYDYIVSLHPRRVIFNPGTENNEFVNVLRQNGIEPVIACTLILLSLDKY